MRYLRIAGWLFFVVTFLLLYAARPDLLGKQLQTVAASSIVIGYGLYLFIGCLRGFTLIPSAALVIAAIPLFQPIPLFVVTLLGILVSSTCIYFFSEWLHLDTVFEQKHKSRLEQMKRTFQKNEMAIIIGWSFFPLVPTDMICYVCGVLEVNFAKFLLAILVGEGTICGIYIFLGDGALRFLAFAILRLQ